MRSDNWGSAAASFDPHVLAYEKAGGGTFWKKYGETSAAIVRMHPAAHSDGASKATRNRASDPQAEARPAFSFGGKERFEDPSGVVG